jgi:hypothetical protein
MSWDEIIATLKARPLNVRGQIFKECGIYIHIYEELNIFYSSPYIIRQVK